MPKQTDDPFYNVLEDMLMKIPLEELKQFEQDAARDVRNAKSAAELVQLNAEWRLIESIYLKRLGGK